MGTTVNRHGRIRQRRGILTSFSDLPFCRQRKFKKLAQVVIKENGAKDVYVFGSHYWGFWDKDSDYDVRIHDDIKLDPKAFQQKFLTDYNYHVDIMLMQEPKIEMNLIRIPV